MTMYNRADLKTILDSDFILNPDVFKPGRRNDDAVDMCCIAWCLDMDPYYVLNIIKLRRAWSYAQENAAKEHVDRVMEYVPNWGKRGTMEAMVYAINY